MWMCWSGSTIIVTVQLRNGSRPVRCNFSADPKSGFCPLAFRCGSSQCQHGTVNPSHGRALCPHRTLPGTHINAIGWQTSHNTDMPFCFAYICLLGYFVVFCNCWPAVIIYSRPSLNPHALSSLSQQRWKICWASVHKDASSVLMSFADLTEAGGCRSAGGCFSHLIWGGLLRSS